MTTTTRLGYATAADATASDLDETRLDVLEAMAMRGEKRHLNDTPR